MKKLLFIYNPNAGTGMLKPKLADVLDIFTKAGDEVTKQVNETGEEKFTTAKEELKPEENDALYYTLTSTKAGTPNGEIRQIMARRKQFINSEKILEFLKQRLQNL